MVEFFFKGKQQVKFLVKVDTHKRFEFFLETIQSLGKTTDRALPRPSVGGPFVVGMPYQYFLFIRCEFFAATVLGEQKESSLTAN